MAEEQIEAGLAGLEKIFKEIKQKNTKKKFPSSTGLILSLLGCLSCLTIAILGDTSFESALFQQNILLNRILYFLSGTAILGIIQGVKNIIK